MEKLPTTAIEKAIAPLEGWSYQNGFISKTFLFEDFVEAFGFISKVAVISEKLNHHPDWSGVYNKVVLRLSTHDSGGVTANDIEFAKMAEHYRS
ncbi:MAG: 4a-hydroxytetrahydrobiopterin dehydratase [Bacteroidota bacterium]